MFAAYIFVFFAMLSVSKLSAFFFRGTFCVVRSALSSQESCEECCEECREKYCEECCEDFCEECCVELIV